MFVIVAGALALAMISSERVTALQSFELNETSCIDGNGTWGTPQIAIGDDPLTSKKNLTPYCSCQIGYFWNETFKSCQNDSELRCLQTNGRWINNSCKCQEGTIKWTIGFGCDMLGPEPKIEKISSQQNSGLSKLLLLSGTVLAILLIAFTLRAKRKEK